ncbi:transmembrane protein, putative [Medicago truncatula]|uniref:Transmembrane protein, putative n=1 Tax=Medicago truncatula TaxID=3880 RepID=A0A072UDG2_MEDTR|nr:transmembrane protein, putative [Medicago truncatula]
MKERFSRLFELSVDKWVSVFDLFQLGWGVNGEAWKWRRRLFAWEEEQMEELCLLLQNVILQADKEDRWIWKLEKTSAYTVRSAYSCQSAQLPAVDPVELKLLWQKMVPLKVVVFVWHLFRNRLQPKITCCGVVFSIQILVNVLLVVILWKLLTIYFFIVLCLGRFGTVFSVGLVFPPLSR